VFFNPQIALMVRPTRRLAIGLAVLGPHGDGSQVWPESVAEASGQTQPSPQRYLIVSSDALIVQPTLSVSYRILPWLSVGAGFIWGIASVDVVNFSEGTSAPGGDDFDAHQDLRSRLQGSDAFVPGVVVGGLLAPTGWLDVGAWFKAQDSIRTRTHLTIESRYWLPSGRKNEDPCAGEAAGCNITDDEDAGSFKLSIPMEAKLGLRYHLARGTQERPAWSERARSVRARDPMSEDIFDLELDLTWANNSAVDAIEVRFDEGIAVRGTDVGFVPQNADVPHEWRDVFGVRLGGDLNVLPNLLALRAGGFMETKGQDDATLNLDFHLGFRAGVSGGATVRLGPVDLSAAYQHTFYGALDNQGDGKVKAVSGDLATGNRSVQAVNGGRLESSLNEVGLSATLRL
jgi:long-chain fatty acid transport protein